RSLRWATAGVGALEPAAVSGRGLGPVARACGLGEDARQLDRTYQELGFTPVRTDGGDAWARWRQRLAEAAQALDLAQRAAERRTTPLGVVESPRGPLSAEAATPSASLLRLVPGVMVGRDWGDAVAAVASLDIDLEEAARSPASSAGAPGAPQPAVA
ncbi:MAG: hypothetical protein CYG61_05955, partial [Actinobacteria bacterium]